MRFAAESLTAFAGEILRRSGVPPEKAALVAGSLVAANLRGVDSHGLQLLPQYCTQIRTGNIRPKAEGHVLAESGACLRYHGEQGLGQVVAAICSDHAARLCREHGLALVTACESNHYGAAAFWAQRIAAHGLIGLSFCNASPIVAPWQGREAKLGTNPLSMALPGPPVWLLDMATTTVSFNKIRNAAAAGKKTIPPNWALDTNAQPTTDITAALTGLLMPLGGYKGSGLAMMVEILCGVLSGGAFSTELGGMYNLDRPLRTSQAFLAIDVARFLPLDDFTARISRFAEMVKSSEPAPGFEEVLLAGEPEWRAEKERIANGIPIPASVWEALGELAASLDVSLPGPAS